jgi:cobalt/nickel transport system ATP-binding protein
VLLLDEPSMFLDPRGRRGLLKLLDEIGGTRLIAAHDLEFILAMCGRVLVIDGGRLVADGPVRSVLADAGLMERHGLEVPYSLRSAGRAAPG